MFPLRAVPGGMLRRPGHTEAAVDFAGLAGLPSVAAICERVNDDGSIMRLPQLLRFARDRQLAIVSIADLIHHRFTTKPTSTTAGPSAFRPGTPFQANSYRSTLPGDSIEAIALVLGEVAGGEDVLAHCTRNASPATCSPPPADPVTTTSTPRWPLSPPPGRGVALYLRTPPVKDGRLRARRHLQCGIEPEVSARRTRSYAVGTQVLAIWASGPSSRSTRPRRNATPCATWEPRSWWGTSETLNPTRKENGAMRIAGKVAVVTGGGNGIGSALAARLAAADVRVVVADLDGQGAERVSTTINTEYPGRSVWAAGDVADEAVIRGLIARAEHAFGPVALYFANAGITGQRGLDIAEDAWDRTLEVNFRAHLRAARLLLPGWLERGEGYFVVTASAAGLLAQFGWPAYTVAKHAAVAFAEWLSITYGDDGIRVSCLCPMGVNTQLLRAVHEADNAAGGAVVRKAADTGGVLEPAEVADAVVTALADEPFLILPHKMVLDLFRQKTTDYDDYLREMRRYQSLMFPHHTT